VGVAGRTGCGKSTLMMTLKRIIEPSSGRILIDGVDIAAVRLFDLRSRVALVPQVRLLLQGMQPCGRGLFGGKGWLHLETDTATHGWLVMHVQGLGQ